MDPEKCGALIRRLRQEAGWTQKELADRLCVTDKAVSKWERAQGCPDISLIGALSALFRVEPDTLLRGVLPENRAEGGNMKRLKLYLCPTCGNVLTAASSAEICCCGRRLEAQTPAQADAAHLPRIERLDGELCIAFDHPMTKAHFLRFCALVTFDRLILTRLYPEQDALLHLPDTRMGTLVFACTEHGLMQAELAKLLP